MRPRRHWPRRVLIGLFGLVALLLLAAAALLAWVSREGSLATALRWGAVYAGDPARQWGQLDAEGVRGSLRDGGNLERLRWTAADLMVEARGARIEWDWRAALNGQIVLRALHADELTIRQRPSAEPARPPAALTLPWPVDLPLTLGSLRYEGTQTVQASDIRAHYRYVLTSDGAGQHALDLQSLSWADGRYRGSATLGAQAPLTLAARLEGQARAAIPQGHAQTLDLQAEVVGPLAGLDAELRASAQVRTAEAARQGPRASLTTVLRPWATMPLGPLAGRLEHLDLATFWPQAPRTRLSGRVDATERQGAWHLTLDLSNAEAGPWDQRLLPLDAALGSLRREGETWISDGLKLRVGSGLASVRGSYRPSGPWQAEGTIEHLDPARLHQALESLPISGSIQARETPQGTSLQAQLQPDAGAAPRGTLGRLALREVAVKALLGEHIWRFDEARLATQDARLEGSGQYDTRSHGAQGALKATLPGGTLSAQGRAARGGAGGWSSDSAQITLGLARVQDAWAWLLRQPLIGAALAPYAAWKPQGALDLDATADGPWLAWLQGQARAAPAVRARVQAHGAELRLTPPGSAPVALPVLDLKLAGAPAALAIELSAQVTRQTQRAQAQLAGQVDLADPRQGRLVLARADAQASDERAQQAARASLAPGNPLALAWQRAANGLAVRVQQPVVLAVQPLARSARLWPDGRDSRVAIDTLEVSPDAVRTTGRVAALPLAWLIGLTQRESPDPAQPPTLGGDLELGTQWDLFWPLADGGVPKAELSVTRERGDLLLPVSAGDGTGSAARLAAGLRESSVRLRVDGTELHAQARWASERAGDATAELRSTLSRQPGGGWTWGEQAPLSGNLRARVPDIAVWAGLAPPGWRVRGALDGAATLAGTRAAPRLDGQVEASGLALRSLADGIEFVNGSLRARLDGERVLIERLALEGAGGAAGGGQLSGTGTVSLADGEPRMDIDLTLDKLRATNRADRRVVLSGKLRGALAGRKLTLRGQLRADQALIVLPDESTPSLGADVVVRAERATQAATGAGVQPVSALRAPFDADVDVAFDLGPAFQVRGMGLETFVDGDLTARVAPGSLVPHLFGEVRTRRGTYRAYGVKMEIETGVLRFSGPLDDPGLDILAIRPNLSQRVGVAVSGSAQHPSVRLYADPDLPDSEKLAWLVLGRPASGAGAEAALLQQAAATLLAGRGRGPSGAVASRLGLDEIGFGTTLPDGTGSAALTLGKRLSNRLYVVYGQSLSGAGSTLSLLYEISRRFTLRARAGDESAIDLVFTLRYD